MKNFKLKRLLSLAFIGCLSTLSASTVFATAGDIITNRATLSFDVGTSSFDLESSPAGNAATGVGAGADTQFVEDRWVNFTVAEDDGFTTTVTAGSVAQVQTFTVTNNGNGTQDFLLAAVQQVGIADPHGVGPADSFNPTNVKVYVETDGVPGYLAGAGNDDAIFIDELAVGANVTVYIVAEIPAVADGSLAVMTLLAQIATGATPAVQGAAIINDDNGNISPAGTYSNGGTIIVAAGIPNNVGDIATGAGAEQIVFGDAAGDVDGANTGQNSDSDSYTVQAAALSLQKRSLILWDPVNGNANPKAITGAYVTYTIVISNTGAASGDLTTMVDDLVLELALDDDFVTDAGPTFPTSGIAGDSFRVTHGGGSARTLPASGYCTADVPDNDGCSNALAAGDPVNIDFTLLMPAEIGPGYTVGELKAGETVTIEFNVIVQP